MSHILVIRRELMVGRISFDNLRKTLTSLQHPLGHPQVRVRLKLKVMVRFRIRVRVVPGAMFARGKTLLALSLWRIWKFAATPLTLILTLTLALALARQPKPKSSLVIAKLSPLQPEPKPKPKPKPKLERAFMRSSTQFG